MRNDVEDGPDQRQRVYEIDVGKPNVNEPVCQNNKADVVGVEAQPNLEPFDPEVLRHDAEGAVGDGWDKICGIHGFLAEFAGSALSIIAAPRMGNAFRHHGWDKPSILHPAADLEAGLWSRRADVEYPMSGGHRNKPPSVRRCSTDETALARLSLSGM